MTSEKINLNFDYMSDYFLMVVYNLSVQQAILKKILGQLLIYTHCFCFCNAFVISWLRNINNCLQIVGFTKIKGKTPNLHKLSHPVGW